jgi:uncharacterized membrane protein
MNMKPSIFQSAISGEKFSISQKISAKGLRESLFSYIHAKHPAFELDSYLAVSELNELRSQFISDYIRDEIKELGLVESQVIASMTDQSTISDKLDTEIKEKPTFGQRVADKVATFGGSWTFIISFGCFLVVWIATNVIVLSSHPFDSFPFILLNLILSCIAAMQAPVIMMSQNRQEEKDRERSKKDYLINLKSELEIRILHDKIDHLMMHQHQDLLEIQHVQVEMMNDILAQIGSSKGGAVPKT